MVKEVSSRQKFKKNCENLTLNYNECRRDGYIRPLELLISTLLPFRITIDQPLRFVLCIIVLHRENAHKPNRDKVITYKYIKQKSFSRYEVITKDK